MTEITRQDVEQALRELLHPDLGKSLLDLEMIDTIGVCENKVKVDVILTNTADPVRDSLFARIRERLSQLDGIEAVTIGISMKTPPAKPAFAKPAAPATAPVSPKVGLPGVKHIIAISSGKGGVGKTSVTVNLAAALTQAGKKVGIVDADVYGPNVPIMTGLRGHTIKEQTESGKLVPPQNHGIAVMSIGFLVQEDQPVVWRGPMLDRVIRQFLGDAYWGELDYLLIDLPPGTGDAQLTIMQAADLAGAVIVTTPQDVALHDSRKGLAMFRSTGVPLLGIVENMSYFMCEHGTEYDIFGRGGGRRTAEELDVPFLGEIPLMMEQREQADRGMPVVLFAPNSPQAELFRELARRVEARVAETQPAGAPS